MKVLLTFCLFIQLTFISALAQTLEPQKTSAFPESLLKPYHAEYVGYYGDRPIGIAKRGLTKIGDTRYQLEFSSEAKYLFMRDERSQRSEFKIANAKVQFTDFHASEKRPFKSREQSNLNVSWPSMKEKGSENGKKWEITHKDWVYDRITHVLQLRADLIANKKDLSYWVTYDGSAKEYAYGAAEEVNLTMYDAKYETLLVKRIRENSRRETFMWLDKNNAYFPVRIMQKKDGEIQLDLRLKSYQERTASKDKA